MLRALVVLMVCQLLGELVSRGFSLPVPGPVMGLLILALGLGLLRLVKINIIDFKPLEATSDRILSFLGLLFVPAGVGVVQQLSLLGDYGLAIVATLVLSTVATLLVTVGTFLGIKRLLGIGA